MRVRELLLLAVLAPYADASKDDPAAVVAMLQSRATDGDAAAMSDLGTYPVPPAAQTNGAQGSCISRDGATQRLTWI